MKFSEISLGTKGADLEEANKIKDILAANKAIIKLQDNIKKLIKKYPNSAEFVDNGEDLIDHLEKSDKFLRDMAFIVNTGRHLEDKKSTVTQH